MNIPGRPRTAPKGDARTATAESSIAIVRAGPDDLLADLRREELEGKSAVGTAELRAAASLVAEGMATRVTLAGFPTWPGLLTEIERLSREFDLLILPSIVRGGGRVDIVVSAVSADGD